MKSPSVSKTNEYTELLDTFVLELAPECPSFDALVRTLPGVYPTEVLTTLDRLGASGQLEGTQVMRLLARQGSFADIYAGTLPVPHPLDFDWRFSRSTQEYLASSSIEAADGQSIVLLGTPTLFEPIRKQRRSTVVLIDSGSHVLPLATDQNLICLDVAQDELPEIQAGVLVMDPPWYREQFLAFLWAAAKLTSVGGEVWTTFPGLGTRPDIEQERRELIAYASSIGLRMVDFRERVLRYDSPPFERAALEAAGLDCIPLDWRSADLAVFVLSAKIPGPRPETPARQEWDEVTAGPVRVRLRRGRNLGIPLLEELVDGEVLASVSAREPLRNVADVWTACNRVFRCPNTLDLSRALRARAAGLTDLEMMAVLPEQHWRRVLQQLDNLLWRETSDLRRFGWQN
jgi:hypothetical protein